MFFISDKFFWMSDYEKPELCFRNLLCGWFYLWSLRQKTKLLVCNIMEEVMFVFDESITAASVFLGVLSVHVDRALVRA